MAPIRKLTLAAVTRKALIAVCAIGFGTALATGALAAEHADHGGRGHVRGGFSGSILTTPSTPPMFNPYSPYTLPQAPESPVSPASPGSVFGNN
jgi:hypothetical protein